MKGMCLDECLNRAQKYIKNNGACVLGFDVKGSHDIFKKNGPNCLREIVDDINSRFVEYFPVNSPLLNGEELTGFRIYRSDSGYGVVNSVEGLEEIIDYKSIEYPHVPFYWIVAKDVLDKDTFKLI